MSTSNFGFPENPFFKSIPTTPDDVKVIADKVAHVISAEAENVKGIAYVVKQAMTGDAKGGDITDLQLKSKALMNTARFAAVMAIPGAVFALPQLTEFFGSDFVPASVKQEFDI